jgi:hypothetical protein
MSLSDRLIQAWTESSIVSGTLALAISGAVIYLAVVGQPVPDVLGVGFGAVVTWFFTDKSRKDTIRQLGR